MILNYSSSSRLSSKLFLRIIAITALIGVADTVYLTANYYFGGEVKCVITEGCEIVLTSQYSKIMGIPLAALGVMFYSGMFILVNVLDVYRREAVLKILMAGGVVGFAVSLVLLYLQIFVIEALCIYCLTSFVSSGLIFISCVTLYKRRFDPVGVLSQQSNY